MALTTAQAADLGGDCCADLEERVAELEATAVYHGNRTVKVTLSGQVNSQVMYWDNGIEDNVFVVDSDEASSRIRLDATGTISPGWTAGLIIEFDIEIAGGAFVGGGLDPNDTNDNPSDDFSRIQLRRANWWVNGPAGRLSVGNGSEASDGALEVSFANTWVASVGYGLATTNINGFAAQNLSAAIGTTVTWGTLGTDQDRFRTNRVRYDTPTFAGFTLSTSWGEDDVIDVALRYANEFGGLKVAAAVMYSNDDDDFGRETDLYGGSLAFMFSNVHIQGGYAHGERDAGTQLAGAIPAFTNNLNSEVEHWWVAAGVQFRAFSLGLSDITIQYINNEYSGDYNNPALLNEEYDAYGIGFAQNIDAIGGTFYISYNHHEAEGTASGVTAGGVAIAGTVAGTFATDEFDQVQVGMRLRY